MHTLFNRSVMMMVFAIAIGSGCKDKGSDADDPDRKATPEECQRAYEHLADLEAADGKFSKQESLDLARGNIEHCPRMRTKAGIDCLLAMTKHNILAEADCGRTKR